MDISTSALVAQRTHIDTIAGNIANMHVTRDAEGRPNPYQRRIALFATGNPAMGEDARGVHIAGVVKSQDPFRLVYDPDHPDAINAGENAGYVRYPNVDYSTEMINGLQAARIYEANVTVMEITKTMASAGLRLLA
jgi:flagellar basal-body rod protein FlgC